jgi:hypothetical protein
MRSGTGDGVVRADAAQRFEIPTATGDHREVIDRDDIDVID